MFWKYNGEFLDNTRYKVDGKEGNRGYFSEFQFVQIDSFISCEGEEQLGGLGGRSPEFCLGYVNFERHISYLCEYAELSFRGEIRTAGFRNLEIISLKIVLLATEPVRS